LQPSKKHPGAWCGTRFMNIDAAHRRVEIGATWLATPWQRTTMNTEAKYLMLRHALRRWAASEWS
jgi:RimJ/RimL family protein N-acetyltransferase